MYKKRKLNDKLSTFHGLRYPYFKKPVKKSFRYEAVVGIGGNVGDVKRRFEHLFVALQREKTVELFQTSLILKNPPFGYEAQDDFFNSIIFLKTAMTPKQLLRFLLRLEKRFGRKRSFANAPRTLDLDIIFFDNRKIDTKDLKVPHPHWQERESVVIPLLGVLR
ncbi:MAG: 2-amino-4-hydroxy-6-hydroxymethyldihydropteridine diphosphokinase [Sulfurimonas sp.]